MKSQGHQIILPFLKKSTRVCLTTSGARIGDLVVLFCAHSIPKRSHEKVVPYAKQEFFYDSQNLMGVFLLLPSAIQGLRYVVHSFVSTLAGFIVVTLDVDTKGTLQKEVKSV